MNNGVFPFLHLQELVCRLPKKSSFLCMAWKSGSFLLNSSVHFLRSIARMVRTRHSTRRGSISVSKSLCLDGVFLILETVGAEWKWKRRQIARAQNHDVYNASQLLPVCRNNPAWDDITAARTQPVLSTSCAIACALYLLTTTKTISASTSFCDQPPSPRFLLF